MLVDLKAHAHFLAEASRQLNSSLEYDASVRNIVRAPLGELADWTVLDVLDRSAAIERVAVAHIDPEREPRTWQLAQAYVPSTNALEGVPRALRELQVQRIDLHDSDLLGELGGCSSIIAPLFFDDRVLGALTMGWHRRYSEDDVELAVDLAGRCAQALAHADTYRMAHEAVEIRDAVLASISHDLRNPLATISAQAELLRRLVDSEMASNRAQRMQAGIQRIQTTSRRMSRMIDGLVDIAQQEHGRQLHLDPRPTDLVAIARELAAEHQERARRHLIQLAGEASLVARCDRARFERVLDNLVGNAVKYSPGGGVITIACAREVDETGAWAIVSVRDSGIGIPPADLDRIFEAFQRATNVGDIAGSGIGLSAVKDIVAQHGGMITADSDVGRGTTITIRLPLERRI